MPDQTSNGMQCQEFDGLLSNALDGVLTGAQLDRFQAHVRTCSACGPLFAEVGAGRNWLKDLTEVEPPVSLVMNILASTTGVDTQRLRVNVAAPQPRITWVEKAQAWASGALQPIFAQTWATVCHVFWHGVLFAVGGVERPRCEAGRSAPVEFASRRHSAHVLQHASPRCPVLRKYPVRLRGGIAGA